MNNVIYFGNYEGCNHNSDLLLYILYRVAELRKNNCDSHKVGVHTMHAGVVCLKMEDLPLSIILLYRHFEMYALQSAYRYVFMVNTSFKLRI